VGIPTIQSRCGEQDDTRVPETLKTIRELTVKYQTEGVEKFA
jgi:hypothetical protein